MTEILAVFASRTQATAFAESVRRSGIACRLVPTPAELKTGCGLSVCFYAGALRQVRRLAAREARPVYRYVTYDEYRRAYVSVG